MKWYRQKWWTNLWGKKSKEKIDVLTDIQAISDCLDEVERDIPAIRGLLKELEELHKESEVTSKGIIKDNLKAQVNLLDGLLERYEFFQTDIDINGLRVKKIAKELLRRLDKEGMKDLLKEKKNDQKWFFEW